MAPYLNWRELRHPEFDDVPILFGDHFLVQHQPDEFVVTVGRSPRGRSSAVRPPATESPS